MLRWSFATGSWVQSSPLLSPDGVVYVGANDAQLYALKGSAGPATRAWSMFRGNPQRTGRSPGP
jgi:outer membrane protein assembly factor BamB